VIADINTPVGCRSRYPAERAGLSRARRLHRDPPRRSLPGRRAVAPLHADDTQVPARAKTRTAGHQVRVFITRWSRWPTLAGNTMTGAGAAAAQKLRIAPRRETTPRPDAGNLQPACP
jgi:hypothetical protein